MMKIKLNKTQKKKKRKLLNESMKLKKRNDEFVFAAQLLLNEMKRNEMVSQSKLLWHFKALNIRVDLLTFFSYFY